MDVLTSRYLRSSRIIKYLLIHWTHGVDIVNYVHTGSSSGWSTWAYFIPCSWWKSLVVTWFMSIVTLRFSSNHSEVWSIKMCQVFLSSNHTTQPSLQDQALWPARSPFDKAYPPGKGRIKGIVSPIPCRHSLQHVCIDMDIYTHAHTSTYTLVCTSYTCIYMCIFNMLISLYIVCVVKIYSKYSKYTEGERDNESLNIKIKLSGVQWLELPISRSWSIPWECPAAQLLPARVAEHCAS